MLAVLRVLAEELSSARVESADIEVRRVVGQRAGSQRRLVAGACCVITDHFGHKELVVEEELVEGVVEELVALSARVFPWAVELADFFAFPRGMTN